MSKPWQWKPQEQTQAEKAHAEFYFQVAREADEMYLRGGENVVKGLGQFDEHAAHLRAGQRWATENSDNDEEAARLAADYPNAAVYVLDLRLGRENKSNGKNRRSKQRTNWETKKQKAIVSAILGWHMRLWVSLTKPLSIMSKH